MPKRRASRRKRTGGRAHRQTVLAAQNDNAELANVGEVARCEVELGALSTVDVARHAHQFRAEGVVPSGEGSRQTRPGGAEILAHWRMPG
ncbi:MAG TPA: hypothetical protein VKB37_16720 [Jatrophihabitantaceae bacterium]|nr:hypothetical protein [Jatrophihabitantaceae bacterium]